MAPRGLAYFSLEGCRMVAHLFNLIEEGAPWPNSTRSARVVFLEKAGAAIGEVMSYRPLAIVSPFYRAWDTMRLRRMADWVISWVLPQMHAGVPEMGAVDAWHVALTELEDLKLASIPYCGGVADIAKFFDRLIREVVYTMAAYAGMARSWSHTKTASNT